MNDEYCGYVDQPACPTPFDILATTGGDGGEFIIVALVAVLVIGLGIRLIRRKTGRR